MSSKTTATQGKHNPIGGGGNTAGMSQKNSSRISGRKLNDLPVTGGGGGLGGGIMSGRRSSKEGIGLVAGGNIPTSAELNLDLQMESIESFIKQD